MDGQSGIFRGMKAALAAVAMVIALLPMSVRGEGLGDNSGVVSDLPFVDSTTEKVPQSAFSTRAQGPKLPAVSEKSAAVRPDAAVVAAAPEKAAPNAIEDAPIGGHAPKAQAKTDAPATPTTAPAFTLPSGVMNALQVAAALTVVVGLILIGKALAKKFIPGAKAGNGKGVIEVLARYPLCKNQSLVLVRIGSQIVTLNQCKDSSQSVLVVSDPTEVAKILGQVAGESSTSIQAGFNKLLANARMDLEDPANDPDQDDFELRSMEPENLDDQLEEMASAKRQLMELRQQVRSVRDSIPRS
jgi:flagellar biogenesis protein FliO